MFKNQTPQQLSVYVAAISAVAIAIAAAIFKQTGALIISWGGIALLFVGVFAIVFVASYRFIRYYIFRRIKLIYKIIHRHKLPSDFKATVCACPAKTDVHSAEAPICAIVLRLVLVPSPN